MDHIPDQHRALRARLMELTGAVKAYFEATAAVSVGSAGYWGAFDALRKNQALAQSFVGDLQALLDHLEREVLPALSSNKQAAPSAPVPAQVQAQAAPAQPHSQASINEEATMLLNRLPESVQKEAMRLSKELESARATPQKPPSVVVDDGDDSLIQEVMTDPEIDLPAQRPPVLPPQGKAQPPSQPKPPAVKAAAPVTKPADREVKPAAPAAKPLPGLTKGAPSPAPPSSRSASAHQPAPAKDEAKKDEAKKDAPRPALQGQGAIAARIAAVAAAAKASAAQAGQPPPPSKTAERPAEKPTERTIERQAGGKLPGAPATRPQASPVSPSSGVSKGAARPLGSRTMQQPTPQFDETDVTSPGFTLEPGEDPHPAKRR